jgi:hypothetical protein
MMRSRENLPLVVMSAVAAAIIIFFVASERSGHALQRQIDGCGWAGNPAMAAAWPRVGSFQTASWNPAFPPSSQSPRPAEIGCMKSNTTGIA